MMTAPGNKDNELTMNRANIGGAGEIKRGAAYARDKINTLLVSLHTEHTSGRQKALRKFEDYFFTFRPNLLEGDARTLLEGDALRRGLVQECGAMSENHVGELKKTGVEVSVVSHNMNYITHPSSRYYRFFPVSWQTHDHVRLATRSIALNP